MRGKVGSEDKIVSFDDEKLIVVDKSDNIIGYKTKSECHRGRGILHRAFSVFLFNAEQELIIQQRSTQKNLWPGFWSNSCCSHPRKGEEMYQAARRRLKEELDIETDLIYLYTFQYHASFGSAGSENESCAVFIGSSNDPVHYNRNEIAACKYIHLNDVSSVLDDNPAIYTPWFKMEWQQLIREYRGKIYTLFA